VADTQYDVYAEITLKTKAAQKAANRLGGGINRLGGALRSANFSATNMVASIAALGASYVGFRALTATISSAAKSMYAFETSAQQTKLGLATLLDALGGDSNTFAQAKAQGMEVYGALQKEAAKTTATTQDLLEIFTGIVAPVRAAGVSMERIQKLAVGASRAGSALGIDQEQLTRDMTLLAEGRAGMDVKTFNRMRPFLKEQLNTTEEWNKATAPERVAELERVFTQMSAGAKEFERSIGGRTSTFKDLFQQIRGAFAAPVLQAFADKLGIINDYLFKNLDTLKQIAGSWGQRLANRFNSVFASAESISTKIAANWDTIAATIKGVVAQLKQMLPKLMLAGKIYAVSQVAAPVAGMGLQAAGGLWSGVSSVAGAVTGGGAAAGGSGVLTAAATAAAPLAAVAATIAAIGIGIKTHWAQIMNSGIGENFRELGVQIVSVGKKFGGTIWNLLRVMGSSFVRLLPLLKPVVKLMTGFFWALDQLAGGLYWVTDQAAKFTEFVTKEFLSIFNTIFKELSKYWDAFKLKLGIEDSPKIKTNVWDPKSMRGLRMGPLDDLQGSEVAWGGRAASDAWLASIIKGGKTKTKTDGPNQRPTVVNDWKNSRITIKQEFRDADPDRVAVRLMRDLEKVAERRTESDWSPAFTTG